MPTFLFSLMLIKYNQTERDLISMVDQITIEGKRKGNATMNIREIAVAKYTIGTCTVMISVWDEVSMCK